MSEAFACAHAVAHFFDPSNQQKTTVIWKLDLELFWSSHYIDKWTFKNQNYFRFVSR